MQAINGSFPEADVLSREEKPHKRKVFNALQRQYFVKYNPKTDIFRLSARSGKKTEKQIRLQLKETFGKSGKVVNMSHNSNWSILMALDIGDWLGDIKSKTEYKQQNTKQDTFESARKHHTEVYDKLVAGGANPIQANKAATETVETLLKNCEDRAGPSSASEN